MDSNKKRHLTQTISSIAANGNIKGFVEGRIYTGNAKKFCVPILNCYSCPGALGACPIGSIQAVIGSMKYNFSYYVFGTITLIGIVLGRFVCGWLCPFGFIQDLLHKIPSPKLSVPRKLNNVLKYLKYAILALFVFTLPLILQDDLGMSDPYFCKYICPAGTLEGGIPLLLANENLRNATGFLFRWKFFILIFIIIFSIFIYRIFCRYICPLGAFYSLFNPISLYSFKIDENMCTKCNACTNNCKMNIKPYETPNSPECIRCGDCISSCPNNAIKSGLLVEKHKRIKATTNVNQNN
ncbi:MAG: 4Fe-4S binding domain-containing protein [Sporanaerobacter sp.]|uniref:4Fe-4S binding protein n=1 Tax=Sporanaerobacter sp. TaxID=2010183 RepID=UPI003A10213A